MDRFDALQLFVRIVELGSFSRAAAAQSIPRATASLAIKALEARLGTRLLDRTTRHVRPTLDGQAFYTRCVHVLSELDSTESSLCHVAANPRGTLRVDMHGTHATKIVLPRIDDFRARYPHIDLVVSSGDRLVDLIPEGIDCALRAGNPRDSTLVARRLAVMPQVICASPVYLARFGTPCHPDDLSAHQVVKFFSRSSAMDNTLELIMEGQVCEFALPGWMAVNDAENYVISALRGCGLIQLPRFHVEEALQEGQLIAVLPDWPCPRFPLSALYPFHRQLSPRVRVFIDWLSVQYKEKFGPVTAMP